MKKKTMIVLVIISGAILISISMYNTTHPDIQDYTPYNLTLHTIEGGVVLSDDFSDDPIYLNFQENDSNTTFSPRKITQPSLIARFSNKEHLNNSREERHRNFAIYYLEPDSYSHLIISERIIIKYGNSTRLIKPTIGGFGLRDLYTLSDNTIFAGSGDLSSLPSLDNTSVNVTVYENYTLEDQLSQYYFSGISHSDFSNLSVDLSLYPTITYSRFYFFINFTSSNSSVKIVKTFEFPQVKLMFKEYLIEGDLQMGYSIQVFKHRFVFWHPDWLPKGYLVPPWSRLSLNEEN